MLQEARVQLIINTFGASLRKQGEQFVVQAGERKFAVSAHKVQSILICTAAQQSRSRRQERTSDTSSSEKQIAHSTWRWLFRK
jgi:hypothetical protein